MPSPDTPTRKLAAIMFTDIAGFTKLSSLDDTKAAKLLNTQRDLLKPIVERYGGNWLKEIGDGLLLTFSGATSALECAIEIQNTTKDIKNLNLRIGIHQGEIIEQKGDVIGDDVNVASRIEPFAAVGGIAISDKVQRDISSNPEFTTKYIGKPKLKGVAQKVEVYCITYHGLPETKLSDVSAKLEKRTNWYRYIVSAVAVVAILVYYFIPKEKEVPSVGILMMENRGVQDDNFWAMGITEDIIVKVAGAGRIRVAPMKEILGIDPAAKLEEIARELRVKYLLTSSMHKKEDGFDLRCQLIEAESGVSKYANKWSESLDNSPRIVGNLADDILQTLRVSSKQDITKAPTTNPEAYEYYLKAKYKYEKRKNVEDIEITKGFLLKAIQLDKKLYQAWGLLAYVYKDIGLFNIADSVLTEAIEISHKTHNKYQADKLILERSFLRFEDPNYKMDFLQYLDSLMIQMNNAIIIAKKENDINYQARNLSRMGFWLIGYEKYNKALELLESAKKLFKKLNDNKNLGIVLTNIGTCYSFSSQEQLNKGIPYFKDAIKIQKDGNYLTDLARTYQHIAGSLFFNNNLDSAIYYGEKSVSIWFNLGENRRLAGGYNNLGNVYRIKGNMTKADYYYTEAMKYSGNQGYNGGKALLYLQEENYNEAIEIWDYLLIKAVNHNDSFSEAQILFSLGEAYYLKGSKENALDNFTKVIKILEENIQKHEELLTDYYLAVSWCLQIMMSPSDYNDTEKLNKLIDYVGNDIKTFLNEGYPFYENRIKLLLNLANINKKLGNHSQVNRIYHECLSMASNQRIKSNPIILKLMEEIEL